MANLLDKLNKQLANELGEDYVQSVRVNKSGIDVYKTYQEEERVFDIVFSSVDPDGTFSTMDGDVKLVLTEEEFNKVATSNNTYATANLLGVTMQVKVVNFDPEGNKVYVALAGSTKLRYAVNMRNEINDELSKSLAQGKHPIVWGLIKKVTKQKVMVDILGRGILGFVNANNWCKDYVRTLEGKCKEGEYLQFEVLGRAPKMENKPTAYILGRKNLVPSAWDTLDYEGLKEDGVMLVKCLEKPVGKTYWWGTSDRAPGIEILGDFTSKFPNEKSLFVGITYKCKIRKVDKEGRKISVKPFDIIPADAPKVERLRMTFGRTPESE